MSFSNLFKLLSNLPGWRTDEKIIVIESDDWGSIRMPSKSAFKRLEKAGINLSDGDSERYNLFDTLASSEDLSRLFEVLSSFKDSQSNHPVFTAVSLVANPEFDKIKESGFEQYYYEPFTITLNKYGYGETFTLWKEGINKHLFVPQFHGREHLNVAAWMRALRHKDVLTMTAFSEGMWGFRDKRSSSVNFQAAFDLEFPEDLILQKEIISDGLKIFEGLYGYKAKFFVPPNGPFNSALSEVASKNGIEYLSTAKIQKVPLGHGKIRKRLHYLGQKNRFGIRYLTRNAFFEPSLRTKNWVDSCLTDIKLAFQYQKPAVISTHRVNYIGSLDYKNRDNGLKQLEMLLTSITTIWPEAIFLTSEELGDLISKKIEEC